MLIFLGNAVINSLFMVCLLLFILCIILVAGCFIALVEATDRKERKIPVIILFCLTPIFGLLIEAMGYLRGLM